jgi:hypothetical protein
MVVQIRGREQLDPGRRKLHRSTLRRLLLPTAHDPSAALDPGRQVIGLFGESPATAATLRVDESTWPAPLDGQLTLLDPLRDYLGDAGVDSVGRD